MSQAENGALRMTRSRARALATIADANTDNAKPSATASASAVKPATNARKPANPSKNDKSSASTSTAVAAVAVPEPRTRATRAAAKAESVIESKPVITTARRSTKATTTNATSASASTAADNEPKSRRTTAASKRAQASSVIIEPTPLTPAAPAPAAPVVLASDIDSVAQQVAQLEVTPRKRNPVCYRAPESLSPEPSSTMLVVEPSMYELVLPANGAFGIADDIAEDHARLPQEEVSRDEFVTPMDLEADERSSSSDNGSAENATHQSSHGGLGLNESMDETVSGLLSMPATPPARVSAAQASSSPLSGRRPLSAFRHSTVASSSSAGPLAAASRLGTPMRVPMTPAVLTEPRWTPRTTTRRVDPAVDLIAALKVVTLSDAPVALFPASRSVPGPGALVAATDGDDTKSAATQPASTATETSTTAATAASTSSAEKSEEPATESAAGSSAAPSADSEVKDGHYWRNVMQSCKNKLAAHCAEWEAYRAEHPELTDDSLGSIIAAIGQANLLMNKRFPQYAGLCQASIDQSGELKTHASDLAGFWEVIYIQVENIYDRFEQLVKLRDNNWQELEPPKPKTSGAPKRPIVSAASRKPATASSAASTSGEAASSAASTKAAAAEASREAARARLAAAKAAMKKGGAPDANVLTVSLEGFRSSPRSAARKRMAGAAVAMDAEAEVAPLLEDAAQPKNTDKATGIPREHQLDLPSTPTRKSGRNTPSKQ
ncbi:hypothetical protein CAOG_007783 [Capsaspora owczarzaki ATCC 30864]|uniref:Uncharacterized protein n=1 Tax=Capsaspora owczarzaki (strain ATCC 30864) TaxID=595528 RepID=A0A0D2URU0_CAPO3|nr:hypothetical protein CAOG_007783 [Capsaspora owczarzaki ATCC 30864]